MQAGREQRPPCPRPVCRIEVGLTAQTAADVDRTRWSRIVKRKNQSQIGSKRTANEIQTHRQHSLRPESRRVEQLLRPEKSRLVKVERQDVLNAGATQVIEKLATAQGLAADDDRAQALGSELIDTADGADPGVDPKLGSACSPCDRTERREVFASSLDRVQICDVEGVERMQRDQRGCDCRRIGTVTEPRLESSVIGTLAALRMNHLSVEQIDYRDQFHES